jgi:hypothetical protein
MYSKGKSLHIPSDVQAKEKLIHYVHEYLVHLGAKNTAQTFLKEVYLHKTNKYLIQLN